MVATMMATGTVARHHRLMGIDDPLLPAAVHLTGEFADDALRPAVEHAGGSLVTFRCTQVHYRPGHDMVARYRVEIDWGDGTPRRETLYVGTTRDGAPPGTIAVTAPLHDNVLAAGVWRWPFDPNLPALERLARTTEKVLADHRVITSARPRVTVAAYRPTERAVLRIVDGEHAWFAKLVRPGEAADLVRRHELLTACGLPVPELVGHDVDEGLVIMAELRGSTLRDLVKSDAPTWPGANALADLVRRIRTVDAADLTAMRHRLRDGPHHTALLASVLPAERDRLARLDEQLQHALDDAARREPMFVHGDLHERQLIVDGDRIVGLLDIDECGIGDPADDVAVPVAHLRYRALTAPNAVRIHRYADDLVAAASDVIPPATATVASAAVLAGLATSAFRSQTDDWPQQAGRVLDLIDDVLTTT
jgi:aminoglycoside phosphotransferase (APT) family kinase protein